MHTGAFYILPTAQCVLQGCLSPAIPVRTPNVPHRHALHTHRHANHMLAALLCRLKVVRQSSQ